MSARALILFIFAAFTSTCLRTNSQPPVATRGVLDLRSWNFDSNGSVPLNGEWIFYWNELIQPNQFTEISRENASTRFIQVPASWNQFESSGPKGFGTYRLKILLPAGLERLGIRQSGIYTASTIFINGSRILTTGKAGNSESDSVPVPLPGFGVFSIQSNELDVVVHVSNFHFRDGGIRKPLELALPQEIISSDRSALAYQLFLAGAFVLIGIYHMFLFVLRQKDRSPLFFGIHCIGIAGRQLTTGESYLFSVFPQAGYHFHLAVEYATVPIATMAFILFIRSLYPNEIKRSVALVSGVIALILIAALPLLSVFTISRLVWVYQAYLFAGGALCLVAILLALKRGREGSRFFIPGVLILYAGVANDVLRARGLVSTGDYGALTLLIFICIQAALLSVRYATSFRTVENLSSELAGKNVELTRLDKLKDEFLANTSHELRTPLNGIIGITESLLAGAGGNLSEHAASDLRLVAVSGRRLTNLVNDVMDFSRLRNGDIELRRKSLDVSSIVKAVIALSKPLLKDRQVELISESLDVPPVDADEDRFEQILHNLVGNAIKFTKQGRVVVSARPVDIGSKGQFVEISVTDTGIGIPEDKQALIFESFTQADGSISREYGGTGLGLSITRTLVELHGGTLGVESKPTRGSQFRFTLPVADSKPEETRVNVVQRSWIADTAPARTQAASPGETSPRIHLSDENSEAESGPARILIVDDDPVNLRVLQNHLTLHGYRVTEAMNGRAALESLEKTPFDLVLLDVMMPGLSGYEVCRILRESRSQTELPVIMLTAKNRIDDMLNGLESGANDYLVKPFDARELIARVNTMLALKRAAQTQSELATLRNELTLARALQQTLLPRTTPNVDGLKIAARYRSMEKVGGDYYDIRPLDGGLAAIMSDVSGHGVPAALIVSMVKLAFWFQKGSLPFPDQVLTSMNEILLDNTGSEFITACYVFIDLKNKRVLSGNAGHPPVIVWKKKEKKILTLRPKGRLLGLFVDAVFKTEELPLESGDRILMYTDGVTEANASRNEIVHFGQENLESFIRDHEHLNEGDFADLFLKTLVDWCGGYEFIEDDIAFVIMDVV